MRRRRKIKYTWLPQLFQDADEAGSQSLTVRTFAFTNDGVSPGSSGIVTPVLADIPQADDSTGLQVSMADALGSEYFLKRIVGKCFVTVSATAGNAAISIGPGGATANGDFPDVITTCGFYVAPEEHPAGSGVPMGFAADSDRYNPQTLDAIREPWIWRRSWLLNAGSISSAFQAFQNADNSYTIPAGGVVGLGTLPSSNVNYGSVLDGPHIDAKTARRIRQHERLWFTAFSTPVPIGFAFAAEWDHITTNVALECRYLGALRKARNRSSFE